jgi:hypothetical protein
VTVGAGVSAAALALAAALPGDDEQLDLLPPTRFMPGTSSYAKLVERVKRERAGRPPGARNLATREVLAFVRRLFGDPVIERARWLRHTPQTLAAELGCSKAEAFDRLDRIRADLQRLFYAPLAPVDGAGNAVPPTFNLTIGGRQAGGPGRLPWDYEGGPVLDAAPDRPAQESEQNQALLAEALAVSHGEVSHGDAK